MRAFFKHERICALAAGLSYFSLISCVTQPLANYQPNNLSPQENARQIDNKKSYAKDTSIEITIDSALLGKQFKSVPVVKLDNHEERGVGFNKKLNTINGFGVKAIDFPQPVRPILDCVRHNNDNTYTAFFGYLNENTDTVTIPLGSNNQFTGVLNRGQPTNFAPGRTAYYPNSPFSVDFDGSNLVWTLNGRTSTASSNPVQKCGDPLSSSTPSPPLTGEQLFANLDQVVLDKANQLIDAGQGQCVYLPPLEQRQNANCNSNGSGFECSGSLNKTIQASQCSEIAIYGGAININNAIPNTKLFVAVQNNLTINQSVNGVLITRGDLNTSINNSALLRGVFVGARSNNFNLSDNAKIEGLYTILNGGGLAMNLNPSAIFEGELCTTGQANINRNGNSQMIYNPDKVTSWQTELPFIASLMCESGAHPYTQIITPITPTPTPTVSSSPIATPTPTATLTPVPTSTTDPIPTPAPGEFIFDPERPELIGNLIPSVPGNNPNAVTPETPVTTMSLNGEMPSSFKSGTLMVAPSEPAQQNLAAILEQYDAKLLSPDAIEGFYAIQINLSRVSLENLYNNLKQFNSIQEDGEYRTGEASFGNLESAKTFSALVELMSQGLIRGGGLDFAFSNASLSYPESPVQTTGLSPNIVPNAENSWWLNAESTNVVEAWRYSMGYNVQQNRPIKVAVIDSGFQGLGELSQPGGEMGGNVLWDEGRLIFFNKDSIEFLPWTQDLIEKESLIQEKDEAGDVVTINGVLQQGEKENHGTRVSVLIAAKAANGRFMAGVAPHANIVPIKLGKGHSWYELYYALYYINAIMPNKPDIINMSLWSGDSASLYGVSWTTKNIKAVLENNFPLNTSLSSVISTLEPINNLTQYLESKAIIMIASAGNGGWDIKRNFPAGPNVPKLISVGALEPLNNGDFPPSNMRRAIFDRGGIGFQNPPRTPDESISVVSYASNWGDVDIWSPGQNLLVPTMQDQQTLFWYSKDQNGGKTIILDENGNHYTGENAPGRGGGEVSHELIGTGFSSTTPNSLWNGTSAAAPIVAGIAALAKAINPNITNQEFKSLAKSSGYTYTSYDSYLRSFPVRYFGSTPKSCGDLSNFVCGFQQSGTINMKIINAKAILSQMSTVQEQVFEGAIEASGNNTKRAR